MRLIKWKHNLPTFFLGFSANPDSALINAFQISGKGTAPRGKPSRGEEKGSSPRDAARGLWQILGLALSHQGQTQESPQGPSRSAGGGGRSPPRIPPRPPLSPEGIAEEGQKRAGGLGLQMYKHRKQRYIFPGY